MNENPGQQGGQDVKACPQLVRDPGRLPGIYSSIDGIPECGDTDISGQVCCKHQILTVVLFPPRRWAHVRGLINVDWLANCLQTTPPGRLKEESSHGLCALLSPGPICLALYHRGPVFMWVKNSRTEIVLQPRCDVRAACRQVPTVSTNLIALRLYTRDVTGGGLLVETLHPIKPSG